MNRTERKKMIAAIYKNIYKEKKERKAHLDVLEEVIYQDEVCADFRGGTKFKEIELRELLLCKNAIQVARATRKYRKMSA